MFQRELDVLCIGDVTSDAFIRLKDAHVSCKINREDCELCMRFGDKIPFEYVKVVHAVGNAANAATAAARLGLRSALVSNIGDDQNGKECLTELQKNKVITSLVTVHPHKPTNYHFVLWYDVDRTILVNHTEYDYRLAKLPRTKWLYLTSLGGQSYPYHMSIADWLEKNPSVRLAFQPGTFQMKLGAHELKRIFERADVVIVNLEEAQRILDDESRDVKKLLSGLTKLGSKMSVVTDSVNGSYLYDGDHFYHMPMYPDPRPPFERTGCGDAWAATFVSALALGHTPLEALMWAPINPMSVAQFIGSQEGLLTRDQLEWWLHQAPAEYKPREI